MAILHLKSGKSDADRAEDDARVRTHGRKRSCTTSRRAATPRWPSLSERFDGLTRPGFRLSASEIEAAMQKVATRDMHDIRFAQDQIRGFAQAQRASMTDIEVETLPGRDPGAQEHPRAVGRLLRSGAASSRWSPAPTCRC